MDLRFVSERCCHVITRCFYYVMTPSLPFPEDALTNAVQTMMAELDWNDKAQPRPYNLPFELFFLTVLCTLPFLGEHPLNYLYFR